jgi:hypothetical protein
MVLNPAYAPKRVLQLACMLGALYAAGAYVSHTDATIRRYPATVLSRQCTSTTLESGLSMVTACSGTVGYVRDDIPTSMEYSGIDLQHFRVGDKLFLEESVHARTAFGRPPRDERSYRLLAIRSP